MLAHKAQRAVSTVPARDGPTRSTALARCRLRASSMTDSRSKRPSAAAARVAPMHHFLDGRLRRCRSYSYLAPTTTRLLPSASPVHDLLSKSVHPRERTRGGQETGGHSSDVMRCLAAVRCFETENPVIGLEILSNTYARAHARDRRLAGPSEGSRPLGHDQSPSASRPRRLSAR